MEKRIAKCGNEYWHPKQAWIHAFCSGDCAVERARQDLDFAHELKLMRKKAYAENRRYGEDDHCSQPADQVSCEQTSREQPAVNSTDPAEKVFTSCEQPVNTQDDAERRKQYRREWMRKKRDPGRNS